MSDGVSPLHRHMWIWAILGPEVGRVRVRGDPNLAEVLRASGVEVVGAGAEGADAILVEDHCAGDRAPLSELRDAGLVTIALGGGATSVPEGLSRSARVLQLLCSPAAALVTAVRAARLARTLRRAGLRVTVMPTGERARVYGLGAGIWRRRHRLPVGAVVTGARSAAPPSVAEQAVREAECALGARLEPAATWVTESGKVVIELVDHTGRAHILRVAAGPARPPLDGSLAALAALAAAEPPALLRDRIPWPLAAGEVGPARYSVEHKAAGGHPRRMTASLTRECLEVLVALHALPPGEARVADGLMAMAAQARTVAAHADDVGRALLERLASGLRRRLAGVPLGWAHGDFWNENLLARRGRLELIVDWDWAAPRSLPMLDLLDLIAVSERHGRGLPPGPRFLERLWPLAREGGDERIRDYCRATATPDDRESLEALAVAYWLDRVARDLRPHSGRAQRPRWLAENVHAPLSALARAGW